MISPLRLRETLAIATIAAILSPSIAMACGAVDLVIYKRGPATVRRGDLITYEFAVHQIASGFSQGQVIIDNIPQGLTFVSSTFPALPGPWSVTQPPFCNATETHVTCSTGVRPYISNRNPPYTFTMTFRVQPHTPCGPLVNTVEVRSGIIIPLLGPNIRPGEQDINPNNNSASFTTQVLCDNSSSSMMSSSSLSSSSLSSSSLASSSTAASSSSLASSSVASSSSFASSASSLISSSVSSSIPSSSSLPSSSSIPSSSSSFASSVSSASSSVASSASSASSIPLLGCIKVVKEAFAANAQQFQFVPQFSFTLDGGRTLQNDINGIVTFENVQPGTHQVNELPIAGWSMIAITPANGVVTVNPGSQCGVVNFKNQQAASTPAPTPVPPATPSIVYQQPVSIDVNVPVNILNNNNVSANADSNANANSNPVVGATANPVINTQMVSYAGEPGYAVSQKAYDVQYVKVLPQTGTRELAEAASMHPMQTAAATTSIVWIAVTLAGLSGGTTIGRRFFL